MESYCEPWLSSGGAASDTFCRRAVFVDQSGTHISSFEGC